jgi:hypothetical protein
VDADKKGYHLYINMSVMKRFKKMCVDIGRPVGQEVELWMIEKLKQYEQGEKKDDSTAR